MEIKCMPCPNGLAAPQLQPTVVVQECMFSAARPFSFSRESRNPDSYVKFPSQKNSMWVKKASLCLCFPLRVL